MNSDLSLILCGSLDKPSELWEILIHIRNTLDLIIAELDRLLKSNDGQISLYGSFIGRSILELGCTALIARIDPFRVLLLREVQRQPNYQIGTRNKISIQWQGDVLTPDSKPVHGLWADKDMERITRALVGDYYDHIFWRNAVSRLLDTVETGRGGDWLDQLREIGREGFCGWARQQLSDLYSSLSKGLHHEFVVPPGALFDRRTITDLITDSLNVIASLGLALNSISHIPFVIPLEDALQRYENLQKLEIS